MDEMSDAAAVLAQAALQQPAAFPSAFEDSALLDRAQIALQNLGRLNVSTDVQAVLRMGLQDAGIVRAVPQHGDFWPENVLRTETGGWCILDLDGFGDVTVPLYDVLHFIRTSEDARPAGLQGRWIDVALGDSTAGIHARRAIAGEQARWNLTPRAVGGCALFYLMHIAYHISSRGAPEFVWGRFRDEIGAAVRLLEQAGSIDQFGASLLK
jgi:hypothetical protein